MIFIIVQNSGIKLENQLLQKSGKGEKSESNANNKII
jgi:hypothetical protein